MKTVFIVDDSATNLILAKNALDGVYNTFTMTSAAKMFRLTEKIMPDLILLDINMPETDGFEAMKIIKSDRSLSSVPVIFLTAENDPQVEIQGFEMGALDFINKPFSPPVLIKRIETHIETDRIIKESLRAVRKVHNATISVIANMVECREKATGEHIKRTQKYLSILTDELIRSGAYENEMTNWNLDLLLPSAQLHDVGKIVISDSILNKPGKLTAEEFEIIKQHCVEGERIIDEIISNSEDDIFLMYARKFAGYHHEKWDGSGYPRGLSGENIPLEGRIMAVADVYDALVSERPYKKPYSHDSAVNMIKKESGRHFDPKIIEAFMNVADDFGVESVSG